ncbi:YqeG family HAD IIIA-type phosphatase [bacterium]|nr:YqeG family HAD IIIA-type phosphatase [bacterium]
METKSRGMLPDFCFDRITDVSLAWLIERGIAGLLLDMDNTITRWEKHEVPAPEMAWLAQVQSAGISCLLISNGLARKKSAVIAQTGIDHVSGRRIKPFAGVFRQALADMKLGPERVMMIGDSVITDIIGANSAGIWTCLVEPMSRVDFLGTKLYRLAETVFALRRPMHRGGDYRVKARVRGGA